MAASCFAVGAALNREKSEVVVDASIVNRVLDSKDHFVWLGYSFKYSKKDLIIFTDTKLAQKEAKPKNTCRKIRALNLRYDIRLKIYNTYISPIIELFALNFNRLEVVQRTQYRRGGENVALFALFWCAAGFRPKVRLSHFCSEILNLGQKCDNLGRFTWTCWEMPTIFEGRNQVKSAIIWGILHGHAEKCQRFLRAEIRSKVR